MLLNASTLGGSFLFDSRRAPKGDEKSVYGKFDFSIGKHHNSEFTNIHFSKHKFFHSRFSCLSSSAFAWLSAFRGSLTSMKRALQMKGNERSFDECWKHIRADFPFVTAQKRELRVQSSLYWRSALIGRVVKAGKNPTKIRHE